MARDFAHRFSQQLFSRRNLMPGRSSGGMRQRDKIESVFGAAGAKLAANHVFQFCALNKLRDGQSPDRDNQSRLKNFDFFVYPRRTIADFVRRRHAIGSTGRFAGKTTTDSREIDCRSNGGFGHSAKLLKPAEKCLASRVSEWAFQCRLARTGCLSNQHYIAHNRAAGHRRRFHPRTTPAFSQPRDMSI